MIKDVNTYIFKNADLLGKPIDYLEQANDINFKKLLLENLNENKIVLINNFKSTAENLLKLGKLLGEPLLKHSSTGENIEDYIGDVHFYQDTTLHNLPTRGCSSISFHTARAYSKLRPTYFAMLMVNPGWTREKEGMNGESLLVKWSDVIAEYKIRHPDTADSDLAILKKTNFCYKADYVKDEVCDDPLISIMSSNIHQYSIRYWESFIETCSDSIKNLPNFNEIYSILLRFDKVLNSCSKIIEYIMEENQIVIIDNRLVAHGRRAFIEKKIMGNQECIYNPRKILSIHIL